MLSARPSSKTTFINMQIRPGLVQLQCVGTHCEARYDPSSSVHVWSAKTGAATRSEQLLIISVILLDEH